jgi:hypothetical protein
MQDNDVSCENIVRMAQAVDDLGTMDLLGL